MWPILAALALVAAIAASTTKKASSIGWDFKQDPWDDEHVKKQFPEGFATASGDEIPTTEKDAIADMKAGRQFTSIMRATSEAKPFLGILRVVEFTGTKVGKDREFIAEFIAASELNMDAMNDSLIHYNERPYAGASPEPGRKFTLDGHDIFVLKKE
jgi:hypothetical protein